MRRFTLQPIDFLARAVGPIADQRHHDFTTRCCHTPTHHSRVAFVDRAFFKLLAKAFLGGVVEGEQHDA